jgi:hypothetical protein
MKKRSTALLLVLVVLTACTPRPASLRGYAEVAKALESAELKATELPEAGPLCKALMATENHLVEVEQAKVHVCILPADVVVTTADGYSFTAKKAGLETTTGIHIDWAEKPQVFQKQNVLVVFATREVNLADRILSALKAM